MTFRPPVSFNADFYNRELDPSATGSLRVDTPNYWKNDVHGLSNLAYSTILDSNRFKQVADDNKYIVAGLVRHVVDVLRMKYLRKVAPDDLRTNWQLEGHLVLYVATEDLWQDILRLARVPGSGGGVVSHAAAHELYSFLSTGLDSGRLVHGSGLEAFLEQSQDYLEDAALTIRRRPVLDAALDSDDVHAFLCAYETCFHR